MHFKKIINEKNIISSFLFENVTISSLLPEEAEIAKKYALPRKQSFANGRYVARNLLTKLGFLNYPLLIAPNKSPIWPRNIKASISHCQGAAVAIATNSEKYLNLGVDIEEHKRCKKDLWPSLFNQDEINFLNTLKKSEQVKYATMFFSAKESYFKLLNPLINKWIGFHDANIILQDEENFTVKENKDFLQKMHKYKISGKYEFNADFVMTYLALENPSH